MLSSSTREGKPGEAAARFELLIPSAKLGDALAALSAIDEVRSRHEATDDIITFPPTYFMLQLARATQQMYYPEFLPDVGRPRGLPWSSAADRVSGVSESFGTIRYGRLAE